VHGNYSTIGGFFSSSLLARKNRIGAFKKEIKPMSRKTNGIVLSESLPKILSPNTKKIRARKIKMNPLNSSIFAINFSVFDLLCMVFI
jgi:hypothetical protein